MLFKKNSLKSYHDSLAKQVAAATREPADLQHIRRKTLESKNVLEKITKNYNSIKSANVKRRDDINALRKERTLFDHIFKTLEYQIMRQERRLFSVIAKNKKQDVFIVERLQGLREIEQLSSKNNSDELFVLIEDEQRKYMKNLEDLKKDVRGSKEAYQSMLVQRQAHNIRKMSYYRGMPRPKRSVFESEESKELRRVKNWL